MTERVTIDDVRKAGHCVAGARRWFEDYGFDFRAFLRDGIPVEEFLSRSNHDGYAVQVVEHMRAREVNNGRR